MKRSSHPGRAAGVEDIICGWVCIGQRLVSKRELKLDNGCDTIGGHCSQVLEGESRRRRRRGLCVCFFEKHELELLVP